MTAIAWLYATGLAATHIIGTRLGDGFRRREPLTSFSAGVTVTYVFLQLLPEHQRALTYLGDFASLSVLAGFAGIHLAEKYAYQHDKSIAELRQDLKEIHAAFLFIYYLIIGIVLHELLRGSLLEGTLFFIPVLLHTAVSSISLVELHETALTSPLIRAAITVAAVLGVAVAALTPLISTAVFHVLLGLVTGLFLYVVIRDSLPAEESGAPAYFLAGMLIYTAIVVRIWLLG